jgi:hypothetical protein
MQFETDFQEEFDRIMERTRILLETSSMALI